MCCGGRRGAARFNPPSRPGAAEQGVRAHMLRIACWLVFLCGALMCGISLYHASYWIGDPQNLGLNEAKIGAKLGLVYGWPVWMGLPILVAMRWRNTPAWERIALLTPPILAMVIYIGGLWLTRTHEL